MLDRLLDLRGLVDPPTRNVEFASFLDRLNSLEASMLDLTASPIWAPHWDENFMGIARTVASWSKDRSRKVGCVVVDHRKAIVATGYNGFPRGVADDVEARHQRPAKYRWTEHAERNAIYNAARIGIPTEGCRIYLMWYPCMDCARAIVQSGIIEVIGIEPDWNDPQFKDDFAEVEQLFIEAGVSRRFVRGEAPKQKAIAPAAAVPDATGSP